MEEVKKNYSSYTPAQARANKKWRDKNKEWHRNYQLGYSKNYYEQNKETIRVKNLERYYRNKAMKLQAKEENTELPK